jgi:hypothetical protein
MAAAALAQAVPPPPVIPPPLPPPHVAHVFTRVNIPGEDDALDFVAVSAAAGAVRGLPHLGWVDSSAVSACEFFGGPPALPRVVAYLYCMRGTCHSCRVR